MESKIQIIGCGGVGSNLAYLLARDENVKELVLVDHDSVERKNLSRQFYGEEDINKSKVDSLKKTLTSFNPTLTITAYEVKIDDFSVNILDKDALTILATDDLKSKTLIADHCPNHFVINCDRDEYEVKPKLDDSDRHAWVLKSGYSSTQNFYSNMASAFEVYRQLYLGIKEVKTYHVNDDLKKK